MKLLKTAEAILLEKFRTEPFHNFKRLKSTSKFRSCIGGTCSDKTKSYIKSLKSQGIKASLHTALIDDNFKHQLARIEFGEHAYFADVGNGWPSIYLYPDYKEVNYSCYGMNFRTEMHQDIIKVFHTRLNEEKLQMEFSSKAQEQKIVRMHIENRFSDTLVYPFDKGLRFSMLVENNFLFIRNNTLQIYSENNFQNIEGISVKNLEEVVLNYFNFIL